MNAITMQGSGALSERNARMHVQKEILKIQRLDKSSVQEADAIVLETTEALQLFPNLKTWTQRVVFYNIKPLKLPLRNTSAQDKPSSITDYVGNFMKY